MANGGSMRWHFEEREKKRRATERTGERTDEQVTHVRDNASMLFWYSCFEIDILPLCNTNIHGRTFHWIDIQWLHCSIYSPVEQRPCGLANSNSVSSPSRWSCHCYCLHLSFHGFFFTISAAERRPSKRENEERKKEKTKKIWTVRIEGKGQFSFIGQWFDSILNVHKIQLCDWRANEEKKMVLLNIWYENLKANLYSWLHLTSLHSIDHYTKHYFPFYLMSLNWFLFRFLIKLNHDRIYPDISHQFQTKRKFSDFIQRIARTQLETHYNGKAL